MHRFTGIENPEAPLAHHWLDSTHVAWGVVTLGWAGEAWKAEASVFRGREPDEQRWDVEEPRLDSPSVRLSWNPGPRWSLQASRGWLHSPEQLEPEVDVVRTTASVGYVAPLGSGRWGWTAAWGRNAKDPGGASDALLVEGTLQWGAGNANTIFARAERVENDEIVGTILGEAPDLADLPPDEHGHGAAVNVGEVSAGYLRDLLRRGPLVLGAGGSVRMSLVPAALEGAYGERRPLSWLVMLRAALQ
jgi:hypothetical protein